MQLKLTVPFNLDLSVSCGQSFRWRKTGGFWYAPVGEAVWKVKQEGDVLFYDGTSEAEIIRYFGLDVPLDDILKDIDRDDLIHSAVSSCRGLRLHRQPTFECLISYICATCANIPGIQMRIENLAQTYGRPLEMDGMTFYSFPTPLDLACESPENIRLCKVGYRDKYICGAAAYAAENPNWDERIFAMSYADAKRELTSLSGVGPKVADCVLLFAFEKYEAVPIDVWMERIFRTRYLCSEKKLSYEKAAGFAREHFGRYAGYAQEYLFAEREIIAKKGE
ncbi:MAG: 8-oxoguanine DNA glycosylase [Methanocorpusculum parvum]|nr:8-oxoguanine DNA glycosylase [Methanocorpusculum parvum]